MNNGTFIVCVLVTAYFLGYRINTARPLTYAVAVAVFSVTIKTAVHLLGLSAICCALDMSRTMVCPRFQHQHPSRR